MRGQTAMIIAATMSALMACAPSAKPVSTAAEAIALARTQLRGRPDALGRLTARRVGPDWVVSVAGQAGSSHQSQLSIFIDAKTGRVRSYSDEVTDVALIKPMK
jgi:hypothetical protein